MGPFGIPLSITIVYFLGIVGVPILVEVVVHTKWWKNQSAYYFSFNEEKDAQKYK